MRFRISREAERDLEDIALYTEANWGKKQVTKYLRGLNNKFRLLTEHPLINRERTELNPPVRIHHYEQHLILYLVTDDVFIVRILHQNMDFESLYSESN